jgi:hypothetical protein
MEQEHLLISKALGMPVGIIKTKLKIKEPIIESKENVEEANNDDPKPDESLDINSIVEAHNNMMFDLVSHRLVFNVVAYSLRMIRRKENSMKRARVGNNSSIS